jgi:hypothetical protein
MKKSFLLLIFLVSVTISYAQKKGNIEFFTDEGERFYLILNGIRQNPTPETNVRITDLNEGFYRVKVIFEEQNLGEVNKNFPVNPGTETTVMISKNRKGEYKLRYRGEVDISQSNSTAKTYTYTEVEQPVETVVTTPTINHSPGEISTQTNNSGINTNVQINESSTTTTTTSQGQGQGINLGVNLDGVGFNVNVNFDDGMGGSGQTTTTTTSSTSVNTNFSSVSGLMPNGSMCPSPTMDQKKYMDFRFEIENANMFSRQDLILAKIKTNCMTSNQVAGIIQLQYPTVKEMDVAKQAYRYTWDTENYGVVINSFKTDREKAELTNFLTAGTSHTEFTPTHTPVEAPPVFDNNPSTPVPPVSSPVPQHGNDCYDTMKDSDFKKAKQSISTKSFTEAQMTVAKQVTRNNCLSVEQVKEIAEIFSFEGSKLEYVKFAYPFTFDKKNYYLINDIFSFSSSISELNEFIESQER